MKKLSLVIAMAVILTIGGVFATWSYSAGDIGDDSVTIGQLGITSTPGVTEMGTIEITSTGDGYSTIVLNVANDGSHNTILTTDAGNANKSTGKLKVTFTADKLAPDAIKDDVKLNWKLNLTGSGKIGETTLLTIATGKENGTDVVVTCSESAGVYSGSFDIDVSEIIANLNLAKINLPSQEQFNAYSTQLATYSLELVVSYAGDNE